MDQVNKAVEALYNAEDQRQREAAHQFLLMFQEKENAWKGGLQLLSSPVMYVQFYAANLIYHKLSRGWRHLPSTEQAILRKELFLHLHQRCSEIAKKGSGGANTDLGLGEAGLLDPSAAAKATPIAVCNRLAMALATSALYSPKGSTMLVTECLSKASANPLTVLEVVAVLPEQIERGAAAHDEREQAVADLRQCLPLVSQTLRNWLQQGQRSGGEVDAQAHLILSKVVDCIANWQHYLKLTVVNLNTHQLLQPTLALACRYPKLYLPRIAEFVADSLSLKSYPRERERDAAITMVAECISAMMQIYNAANNAKCMEVCRPIAMLTSQLGENENEFIAQGSERAMKLVQFQLFLTEQQDKSICELALEFWHTLQDIPVQKRHPQLGVPVYGRLLQTLLRQVAYPSFFQGWDKPTELDQDAFTRFRVNIEETLKVTFSLLRDKYFSFILNALATGQQQWQATEAILTSIAAVATEVQDAGGQELDKYLFQVFDILMSKQSLTHPLVLTAACRVISDYYFWLQRHPKPLLSCFDFLLNATTITEAAGPAFTKMCRAENLSDPEFLERVFQNLNSSNHIAKMIPTSRRAVVAGLGKLCARLREHQRKKFLGMLVTPIFQALQNGLRLKETDIRSARLVCLEQVSLLTAIVEVHPTDEAEIARPLLEILQPAWALLTECATVWSKDYEMSTTLCTLYEATILVSHSLNPQLVISMCAAARKLFLDSQNPKSIDVLSAAIRLFGRTSDKFDFGEALKVITLGITGNPGQTHDLSKRCSQEADLLRAYFVFCEQALNFSSNFLVPALPHTLALGAICLRESQDRDCLKTVTDYCKAILDPHPSKQDLGRFDHCVQQAVEIQARELIGSCIISAASHAPRHLVPRVAGVLYGVLKRVGPRCVRYLSEAIHALPHAMLTIEEKELVIPLFASFTVPNPGGEHGDRERKFRALLPDFAAICRGGDSVDCLLAYQLNKGTSEAPIVLE